MHFPQEIRDLNQRIHLRDFGIQGFGCGRYIAGKGCHDKRAILHSHTIEFPETGLPGQAFEVGVHRLPNLCQPGSAIAWNTKAELVFFLQGDKGRPRHQIFIDRSKRSTSLDPHVSPMQPVAQMRERCNLVKPPIRFSFFEDELFLGWPEMTDRHTIRQNAPALCIKQLQSRDRRQKRIVSAA